MSNIKFRVDGSGNQLALATAKDALVFDDFTYYDVAVDFDYKDQLNVRDMGNGDVTTIERTVFSD